jgi:hypothetical protein
MVNSTDVRSNAAGLAALAICESLLLALSDLNIIGEREIRGVLEDATAAHRSSGASVQEISLNLEIVGILEHIIAGRNPIPRT